MPWMGLSIDRKQAAKVLEAAAQQADSDRRVPEEWTLRAREIDECPSRSFTPVLGTALLARATNPEIDALALKSGAGPRAYSARSIATNVLVPGAVKYGYDLRATGREPLNNQPFFRYDRIDQMDHVRADAEPWVPLLIDACKAINKLGAVEAKSALAAYLRVRMKAARGRPVIDLRGSALSMVALFVQTEEFIDARPEGGRRGQAFVAAAFDLASPNVRSVRVNDPSRRMPGDVQVLNHGAPALAIEARQKPVSAEEIALFAESLRKGDVASGLVAMLHPEQPRLESMKVLEAAERQSGAFVWLAYGVPEILGAAAVWSGRPLDDILINFPQRMAKRLEEIEASPAALEDWEQRFPEQHDE
jgi:hypothetical protein